MDNSFHDSKFMKRFHCLWCKHKEKMELELEEWKDLCDIAINETINQMHEKKMTLNDAGKMKR